LAQKLQTDILVTAKRIDIDTFTYLKIDQNFSPDIIAGYGGYFLTESGSGKGKEKKRVNGRG